MFRTEQKQHFFTLIVHFHNLLYILICRLPIDRDYMTLQSKSFCDPFLPVQIVNNDAAASKAIFLGGGADCFIEFQLANRNVGVSPGLVVMRGGSCSKGRGFKSWRHMLDGHDIFSH